MFGAGSIAKKSGYACQQANLIASWREAFSVAPGTTDQQFPFGITSLAGGCSEGFPLWSEYQHFTEAEWHSCATDSDGVNQRTSPLCKDMRDDWARLAFSACSHRFSARTRARTAAPHCGSHCHDRTATPPRLLALSPRTACLTRYMRIRAGT